MTLVANTGRSGSDSWELCLYTHVPSVSLLSPISQHTHTHTHTCTAESHELLPPSEQQSSLDAHSSRPVCYQGDRGLEAGSPEALRHGHSPMPLHILGAPVSYGNHTPQGACLATETYASMVSLPRPAPGPQQPTIQSGRSYLRFKVSPRQGRPLAGSAGPDAGDRGWWEDQLQCSLRATVLVPNKAASRGL